MAHTPHRDAESCYEGSRQVLARMPNLAANDPEMDPMARYGCRENRVISSGLSVKVLAGVGIGLFFVAVLGYLLVGDKPTETSDTATWQPQSPAPNTEATPPWAAPATTAPSWQQPAEVAATPWNAPSPTPAWNGQPAAPSGAAPWNGPAEQATNWPNSQNQFPGASASPTELTATGTPPSEPVWGQVQAPSSGTPAASNSWSNPQQNASWNKSAPTQPSGAVEVAGQTPSWPNAVQTAPTFTMPPTAGGMPIMPAPVAVADPNARDSSGAGYSAPSYAAPYPSQAGVNQSMTVNAPTATPSSGYQASTYSAPAGYPDARANLGATPEPRFDPRAGYGTDTQTASQTSYQQAAAPESARDYRTADSRYRYGADPNAASQPNYTVGGSPSSYPAGAGQPSYPTGNPPSYPGSYAPANGPSSYPSATGPSSYVPAGGPSSYPPAAGSTGYPSAMGPSGYPAQGQPSAVPAGVGAPSNYPAGAYPGTSYAPTSGAGYSPSSPVGVAQAPRYGADVYGGTPQPGAAQFQGTIEKPSNVRAGYDSTRPSLY